MQFVDELTIKVQAGKGGNGCVSFRRERHIPYGGPDGGDGGLGGSVFLEADSHLHTLADLSRRRLYKAKSGEPGKGRQRSGRFGEDCVLKVPLGTKIYAHPEQQFLGEFTKVGERLCVARGGQAGLGNLHFKSSTNRIPYQSTLGMQGESYTLYLVLNVLAEVGIFGMPNAGKSTFIQAASGSHSKIGHYPFTTLKPELGVVCLDAARRFVMVDIPGLVPGASQGVGLGIQFLKHLSRCGLLLHLVDISLETVSVIRDIYALRHEMEAFDPNLLKKPSWLVFNKIDLLSASAVSSKLKSIQTELDFKGPTYCVSSAQKLGTRALCEALYSDLNSEKTGDSGLNSS